jgi:hypothetical protein
MSYSPKPTKTNNKIADFHIRNGLNEWKLIFWCCWSVGRCDEERNVFKFACKKREKKESKDKRSNIRGESGDEMKPK